MKVMQSLGQEMRDLSPVLVPMGIAGTIAAYILSQNIFTSIAAALCPIAGFVLYFCVSPLIAVRSLKLIVAVTASAGLAILCKIPFEIFVLTSIFTMTVSAYLTRKIYGYTLREQKHDATLLNIDLLAQRRLENLILLQRGH